MLRWPQRPDVNLCGVGKQNPSGMNPWLWMETNNKRWTTVTCLCPENTIEKCTLHLLNEPDSILLKISYSEGSPNGNMAIGGWSWAEWKTPSKTGSKTGTTY